MKYNVSRLKNNSLKDIRENWEGNILLNNEFSNSMEREKPLSTEILKWQLSKNPQKQEKKADTFKLDIDSGKQFLKTDGDCIVWLGHSSFFIRINNVKIIIDPIFNGLPGIKRLAEPPCKMTDIVNLDYILLSHNHRDHADKRTLKGLLKTNPQVEALLPLKMAGWYSKIASEYQEAAWWQQYQTNDKIDVFFLPAKHWCRRGLTDYNRVLWGSFMIQANGKTIYYAGDTGWCKHFEEISKFFPEIDYALLPIGAYKPPSIMKREHISPNEAVAACNKLNARYMIPMHYATFDLSDEPVGEPLRLLKENDNLSATLIVPDPGEMVNI